MIGQTVREYRIVTELGRGAMGIVYFGEHQVMGRRAAIKVLNPAIAQQEGLVDRFFTEARAVNAIRHPHIVDVTDCGRSGETCFLIMEFLEGETLGARMEVARRLDEATVLRVLSQMASALSAVHERGIIHRDLKPENVFLANYPDYPDFVKVLDFGVVKVGESAGLGAAMTQPGTVLGTPAYMSPEQCVGDAHLDHRSDIYSLGVIAFELLTGRLPFLGSVTEVVRAHLTSAPPSLDELAPDVSPGLHALVRRMLMKVKDERPASMREVRAEVQALQGTPAARTPDAPPPPPPRSPPTATRQVPPQAPARAAPRAWEARRSASETLQADLVAMRLERALMQRITDDTLTLPSFAVVAVRAIELAHDPQVTFARLASEIEQDPLIASRLMRVANNARYLTSARANTLDAAIGRIGIKPLVLLLQELAAEEVFMSRDPAIREASRTVWEHCLAVAWVARRLAVQLKRGPAPEAAYLAGLFHDIGKPIAASVLLDAERALFERSDTGWMTSIVWARVIERTHREVGARVATRWALPDGIVRAISHQDAFDYRGGPSSVANVVRVANALCQREGHDLVRPPLDATQAIIQAGQRVLDLPPEAMEYALAGVRERIDEVNERNEAGDTRIAATA